MDPSLLCPWLFPGSRRASPGAGPRGSESGVAEVQRAVHLPAAAGGAGAAAGPLPGQPVGEEHGVAVLDRLPGVHDALDVAAPGGVGLRGGVLIPVAEQVPELVADAALLGGRALVHGLEVQAVQMRLAVREDPPAAQADVADVEGVD